MAVSKKLIPLHKEATVLLAIVSTLLLAFSAFFLLALYSCQSQTILPHNGDTAIALLDKNLTLLSATPTFQQQLLPSFVIALASRNTATETQGTLQSPLLTPGQDYVFYHILPNKDYTLITAYDKHSGDIRMQQFFFWGMGGFLLFGTLLLVMLTLLIHKRIMRSMTEMMEETLLTESAVKAKSEFMACVSHELRTPLNAVLGYSEMLKEQMFGDLGHPKYREYAENIYTSGSHLLKMINDILEISRAETGSITLHKEAVSITLLIEDCITALSADAAQNGVEIVAVLQENIGSIQADTTKLQQAVMHILANAVKFTPSGGIIHIHASKQDSSLLIRVEDTGMGMSDTELAKAMQGYFSQVDSGLDRRFEGMGLGLSFARKLVELHGGKVMVESIKNKGTTVAMTIPSMEENN